jgi:phosphonate transport system substrate-binding protein
VTVLPDETPTVLQRRFEPLGRYLSERLGVRTEFHPVSDYPATVSALAGGQVDLVWYGGFTFVQAYYATGKTARPLVMRDIDARFRSVFITRPDSGIRSLADLRGRSFVFGSESSTSGHLMPRYFLMQNGIDPDRDFAGPPSYSGAHDATITWVASGRADAGALNIAVWERKVREGAVDPRQVVVFWTTPEYVDYTWAVRGDLDADFGAGFTERLRQAFLDLDPANPAHKEILDLQSAGRFIPAKPEDFRGVEEAARAAGLLRERQ